MSVRTLRYNTATQHFTKSALASTDRDALAFLEAAQIYNTNQQRAIVNLVRSLKRVGLWSKMKAIYPFVGGTASSHKWNLKDPRDVDAAFRLTFSGGWTHSSTGADPNGTNGYANTFFDARTLSLNSAHVSYYSRQNATAAEVEMGCQQVISGASNYGILIEINTSGVSYTVINARVNSADYVSYTDNDGKAFYIANRNTSANNTSYRNDILKGTVVSASSLPTAQRYCYIGAWNNNNTTITNYSTKECAFATIGDGLTDSEASALYNIVNLYQKRLGRAV